MATYSPRGDKIRVQVCVNLHRKSSTHKTRAEALSWARRTEAELAIMLSGEIPDKTFGELLERYLQEVVPGHRGWRKDTVRIRHTLQDPIAQTKLCLMDSRTIAIWRDRRLEMVSKATVRREWNLLASACNVAVREWRWLRENPFIGVKRPEAPQHRDRLVSDDELYALETVAASPLQQKVLAIAKWALETGMRSGEILGLTHADVDLERRVARLERTKNGTRREVPLSLEACRLWREYGSFQIPDGVRDGEWRKMCKGAKLVDVHFHDLRHTAITRLAKKLHVLDLARMVGIRDLKVLNVYYNERAEDIALKL